MDGVMRGARVEYDVADYPKGHAWGVAPTGETARGTVWCVEGDAGLCWCLIAADDGGYRHVPLDRVRPA